MPPNPIPHWPSKMLAHVEALARNPATRCSPVWLHSEQTDVSLCQLCGDSIGRELPLDKVSGFYPAEESPEGATRWTDGHGRVEITTLPSEQGGCTLTVEQAGQRPFSLLLDGQPLGDENPAPLPDLRPGAHTLGIESPTFVPADEGGSADHRRLGVMIRRLGIDCPLSRKIP